MSVADSIVCERFHNGIFCGSELDSHHSTRKPKDDYTLFMLELINRYLFGGNRVLWTLMRLLDKRLRKLSFICFNKSHISPKLSYFTLI